MAGRVRVASCDGSSGTLRAGAFVVRIVLQYFDGCPNWRVADARLREALGQVGAHAEIVYMAVDTPEHAARLGFSGSPTVLIDGRDPFRDEAGAVGLACRIYRTEDGLSGAPTVDQLIWALQQ